MNPCTKYVKRAQAGDIKALAEAFKLVRGMALAFVAKRVPRDMAEDVVQDAFLVACDKIADLRNPEAFPGWFRAILASMTHKALTRARREAVVVPMDRDIAAPCPGPYDMAVKYQTRAMVADIVSSLPEKDREACIQRYIHGRPYKEIAASLGLTLGTLKRRLHQARNTIIRRYKRKHARTIRIGYLPISDHLLAMVSHARHREHGFEIHLQRFLSWNSLARGLESGLLDGAFIMAPLAMAMHAKGVPVIHVLDGHHDGSALTVARDRAGLGGGKVGLPCSLSTHAVLLKAHMGIDVAERGGVRPAYVNPSYVARSMASGEISAFFCAEPWSAKTVAEGTGRVVARSSSMDRGHMCCGLVVREEYARTRAESLASYVGLLHDAADYVGSHGPECGRIQQRYTGVCARLAGQVVEEGHVTFHDLRPDHDRAGRFMKLALGANVLSRPCDLGRFIRPEFA